MNDTQTKTIVRPYGGRFNTPPNPSREARVGRFAQRAFMPVPLLGGGRGGFGRGTGRLKPVRAPTAVTSP